MPVPRREDPGRHGDEWRTRPRPTGSALPHSRLITPTESQRLYRAGVRGRQGSQRYVWEEPPRNGLPFRPYVYRGTGADAFTGEVVL